MIFVAVVAVAVAAAPCMMNSAGCTVNQNVLMFAFGIS